MCQCRVAFLIVSLSLIGNVAAAPGDTELISQIDNAPIQSTDPNLASVGPTQSVDGRYVAFVSRATNLVADDRNDLRDVFVYDRVTDEIERANNTPTGGDANGDSRYAAISGDARFVAFDSAADNLSATDSNDARDVFLRDRVDGATRIVSVSSGGLQGNSDSGGGVAVSENGRFVVFASSASNLVADDTNGFADIFVHDTLSGETTRISVDSQGNQADGGSSEPSISLDGRYVGFRSFASNLDAPDTNGEADIFVHDRVTGQTVRASVGDDGAEANAVNYRSSLSGNGRHIAFQSSASNLVSNDVNGRDDVFVRDLDTSRTFRVSLADGGGEADGSSLTPSISAFGRYVLFQSVAADLVVGDTNDTADYFVHDRATSTTTRVSVDSAGNEGSGSRFGGYPPEFLYNPSISADGSQVAFPFEVPGLVADDTNEDVDIFLHNLATAETTRIDVFTPYQSYGANLSSGVFGKQTAVSADGSRVAFASEATNLTADPPTDTQQIYLRDRLAGTTQRISVNALGDAADQACGQAIVSTDGGTIAFSSAANNIEFSDELPYADVFVYDIATGVSTLVSRSTVGAFGLADSTSPSLSANSRYVAFESDADNLVAGDTNTATDVFVHDRLTATTVRVSVDGLGTQGNGASSAPAISEDGRYVAFTSSASNLISGDTNGTSDIFVHDRVTGAVRRVNTGLFGVQANRFSRSPAISADGSQIAFVSGATNLVIGDTNGFNDVFVHSVDTMTTTRVNVDSSGMQTFGEVFGPTISADGMRIAFWSDADSLVPGDTNEASDVFVHDRTSGVTLRASVVDGSGAEGNAASARGSISADGSAVVFASNSENLTPDTPSSLGQDVFVHELGATLIEPATPIEDWVAVTGGVSVTGSRIDYPGTPVGWINSAISERLPTMGFADSFEVQFVIESDPSGSIWAVGLGLEESDNGPGDIELGLFNSRGRLLLYRNGRRIGIGPVLSSGDIISLVVAEGRIEYRWQGFPIFSTAYQGPTDFYVDAAFRQGPAAIDVAARNQPTPAPIQIPIYRWHRPIGGVTVVGNHLQFGGAPSGWVNTARSARFSRLGVKDRYRASWTIATDPSNAAWIAGLGIRESTPDWRDVDFGLAVRNGELRIVERGTIVGHYGTLSTGDVLGIEVNGKVLSYWLNDQLLRQRVLARRWDFYLDAAFRRGAIDLNDFLLTPR